MEWTVGWKLHKIDACKVDKLERQWIKGLELCDGLEILYARGACHDC